MDLPYTGRTAPTPARRVNKSWCFCTLVAGVYTRQSATIGLCRITCRFSMNKGFE